MIKEKAMAWQINEPRRKHTYMIVQCEEPIKRSFSIEDKVRMQAVCSLIALTYDKLKFFLKA